jgi:hypothetical protein
VYCTLRVTGTLCNGASINKPFVGEGDNSTGIPDYAAAWADAEMQEMMWEMEQCDIMNPDCQTGSCNLTKTREGCDPPESLLARSETAREVLEAAALTPKQWYECERRCAAVNGKTIISSEISMDPVDACERSYETLKRDAAAHGGIVAGTVRSRIIATRMFRCVARVKAKLGKHIFDCVLDGAGSTPDQATQSLDNSIEIFQQQIESADPVQEVSRDCRSVPVSTYLPLVRCVRECQTKNGNRIITVGRLATQEIAARAAAEAAAELLADPYGGIKSCTAVVEPD